MKTSKKFYGKVPCHICSLPIPMWIVNVNHPLVGTIDHVVPLSRGGGDGALNRMPAHRACNNHRGCRDLSTDIRRECREIAQRAFSRIADAPEGSFGRKAIQKIIRRCRNRAADGRLFYSARLPSCAELAQWSDDGGADPRALFGSGGMA